jgi:hypothetical protein
MIGAHDRRSELASKQDVIAEAVLHSEGNASKRSDVPVVLRLKKQQPALGEELLRGMEDEGAARPGRHVRARSLKVAGQAETWCPAQLSADDNGRQVREELAGLTLEHVGGSYRRLIDLFGGRYFAINLDRSDQALNPFFDPPDIVRPDGTLEERRAQFILAVLEQRKPS